MEKYNISLFFVFDRGLAYSLIAIGFPVKRLDFDKSTMETAWGFEETDEFKAEYLKLKR